MSRQFMALLFFLCLFGMSYAGEKAVMKVHLNEEEKGDLIIIMADEGRVLISPKDLLDMGFREVPAGSETGDEGYVNIDSIPGLKLELDKMDYVLRMTMDPQMLGKKMFDLSRRTEGNVFYASDASAFLNYGLNYSAGNNFSFGSLSVPLELGISSNGWFGLSDFSYSKAVKEESFVRLMTSVKRDDPAGLRRLVIGDVTATSGSLGSAAVLGGVSLSSNFSMSPFFIKYPGLSSISGMLTTPSDVEIYANNVLIKKEHISPGQYEFLNPPNITGRGDVEVVVRDAFGREERTRTPYYISTSLLAPGVQEFSYSLGFKREGFGKASFHYSDPAFLGFHRVGISRVFTGGFRAEADKTTVNAGPTASLLIDSIGQVNASIAASSSAGHSGLGFSSDYNYIGKYINGRLSVDGFSRDYAVLDRSFLANSLRLETSAGLGIGQKELGSFSVAYSTSNFYQGQDSRTLSVNYSRPLSKSISFNTSFVTTKSDKRTYGFSAGLLFILGKETSGSIGYSLQDGKSSTKTIAVQQNPPRGEGFGYNLSATQGDNGQNASHGDTGTSGQGFLQYRGPYGIYFGDFIRASGQSSYALMASGGLAFINRSFYFSRPILDSFALVKVGEQENVRVNLSNLEVGTTGRTGEIIVPDIISYYPNSISINETDVPVNYSIREIEQLVSVPYRGGGVVKFELAKLQSFEGRLYIKEKGIKTGAEYWGLELRADDSVVQAIVGKRGEFYLENASPGTYSARLFLKDRECLFKLIIPKSDEPMVEMGEVVCEMD